MICRSITRVNDRKDFCIVELDREVFEQIKIVDVQVGIELRYNPYVHIMVVHFGIDFTFLG